MDEGGRSELAGRRGLSVEGNARNSSAARCENERQTKNLTEQPTAAHHIQAVP